MRRERNSFLHKTLSVAGIALSLILVPILVINCTLLIKRQLNRNAVPDFGGIFPFIVLTDSMSPKFDGGDLIICQTEDAADVQVGDVIAYSNTTDDGISIVAHRVVEITEDEDGDPVWRTKGDANNAEDIEPVSFDRLVGVWTNVRLAGIGSVAMFMQSGTGIILCVVLPLLLLAEYDLMRHRYERKQRK